MHQIYQGNCFPEGTDPTVEGFDPLAAVLKYYNLEHGRDNLDFDVSEDKKNFRSLARSGHQERMHPGVADRPAVRGAPHRTGDKTWL